MGVDSKAIIKNQDYTLKAREQKNISEQVG